MEILVDLFNRLVDLYNFEVVLAVLTPFEVACVQCRIGILHYFNPLKPEGFHTTDLSLREERVVAKMLAALSFVEPGENWVREWNYFMYCCSRCVDNLYVYFGMRYIISYVVLP